MRSVSIVIDQSTTASKVYLIDEFGKIVDERSHIHDKIYPRTGWVEHDPEQIQKQVMECIYELMKVHQNEINVTCVCITNQRETVVGWDEDTGKPVYNAIVWQCSRTHELCRQLIKQGYEPLVLERTGLKIDPYFSATKMKWILDHTQVDRNKTKFGTIDSWLIYNLTNRQVHATDHTNASRTLLYNLENGAWDDELCGLFGIDQTMLPEIKCSDEIFGYTDLSGILNEPVVIRGVMGDSQAAFYAQQCVHEGDIKMTLGTGSSIMMNVSELKPRINGLVNVLGYKMKADQTYGVEGIVNCNGESLNWAKEDMKLFSDYNELDENLFEKPTSVLFVPALTGLSMPYWNPVAQGMIIGIERQSTPRDFLKGIVEGIVCQLCDALSCFEVNDHSVHVDGGLSKNKQIMQLLADLSNRPIEVCNHPDLSAMGAWLAGSKKTDFEKTTRTYFPNMSEEVRRKRLERYHRAIDCALMLANIKKEEKDNETGI
ncbi:glycerol kinase [Firmicutes bacterium M10-2]|nr:glycerol kinase [Firmicutes bacterium M10-2]